ncbi:MAG TPA: patatin-like phospholipase family protein [Thermoanaerobaculia bacterium]|nr:patatin-like phospholipase family protein [Thermoanaerobaculia bacterium]
MTDALRRLRDAKKVAFVFSGGSSRCAFQIGAIERLLALGVRPAMTVGVSAGAWNAAVVAARIEHRARFVWKSFARMPALDLRNLFIELSPWRYAQMHRRNFARFFGNLLHAPEALPCFISVTRLRDRAGFLMDVRQFEKPIDLLLAANYLPPFYTRAPLIFGERFGDGGVTDNAPYQFALEQGCDAVVLICMKGETEGGIYKSTVDPDHEIPPALQDRVVVIRPRHRLPYGFVERRWSILTELMHLGDLRTREILLGERHPETDVRAAGEAPSVRLLRLWRMVTGGRGSAAATRGPVEPAPR